MSDFARKQLEKFGWCEGKGLGKKENGIVQPIKTKLKFDNQGIGHDNAKQWTSAWWCDMFNDASKRIKVNNNETGVHFTSEDRNVASPLPSAALVHKSFIKAGTTPDSTKDVCANDEDSKNTTVFSDSLFSMCEGSKRTCDNYSLMKGKIKRIRKQEAIYEQKCAKKRKSKKKKKKAYLKETRS